MDSLNVALLDSPTSPTSSKQGDIAAPLDFSHLTPLQFGITTNSFSVPKDKSRVSQLKARRRSTIGVRGSPETNNLIRYIAKQRMRSPSPATEHLRLQSSLPRSQTLKQKMAAFQIVMEEVDEEGKLELMIAPGESDQKLDCIGAGNPQSDKLGSPQGKENRGIPFYLAPTTPPPSKRVRGDPLLECKEKIRGATFSVPACTSQSSTFYRQVQHMPFSVLSQQTNNHKDDPGISSVKKKRVHFGAPLSPEFFDRTLPPSTPLQKGGTPFRHPASAGSKLRSLLKTPQRIEAPPLPQPSLNSPEANGGSPTLSQTKVLGGIMSSDIVFQDTEDKVPPLILEDDEVELEADLNSAGVFEDASSDELARSEAPVVTSLFQEESPLEKQTGVEPECITSPQQPPPSSPPPPLPLQQQEQQDPTTSRSPTRPRGRKRKQPAAAAESESHSECRRSSRTASTSASGKKAHQARCQSEPKRVRFGVPLSPEFFDKTLPPSTPLQKGSTPFRQPASAGSKLCSVLKTPQGNEAPPLPQPSLNSPEANSGSPTLSQTKVLEGIMSSDIVFQDAEDKVSLPQPSFNSPETDSGSPTLCQTKVHDGAVSSNLIVQDADEQIPWLLLEEDGEVEAQANSAGITKDVSSDKLADSQAPNMNLPCQVEHVLEEQTGVQPENISSPQQQPPPSSPPPLQQQEQQDPTTSRSPARPRGRKRKPAAAAAVADESEPQPVRRRSSRSSAASASGKMKDSTGKRRFGSKEVDRSLYGRREYASKNPLLSPILEFQLSKGVAVTQPNPAKTSTGKGVRCKSLPTQKTQSETVSDVISAATRWRQRYCPQPIQETSETSYLTEAEQPTSDPLPKVSAAVTEVSCPPSQTASSTTPRGRGRPRPKSKHKTPKSEAALAKPALRRSRRSGSLCIDASSCVTEGQSADEDHENESGQNRGQIHSEEESARSQPPSHEGDRLELSPQNSSETVGTHGAKTTPSHEPSALTEDQTEMSTDRRHVLLKKSDLTEVDQSTSDPLPEIPADVTEVSCPPSQTASSTTPRGRGRPGPKPKHKTTKSEAASAKPALRRSRRSGSLCVHAATHEAQSAGKEHENEAGQNRDQVHTEGESALIRPPPHEDNRLELSPLRSSETASTHGAKTAPLHEPSALAEDQTEMSIDHRHLPEKGDNCDADTWQHLEKGQAGKQRRRSLQGTARRRSLRSQNITVDEGVFETS